MKRLLTNNQRIISFVLMGGAFFWSVGKFYLHRYLTSPGFRERLYHPFRFKRRERQNDVLPFPFFPLIVLLLMGGSAHAGPYVNEFLQNGFGVRAHSMGGAFVAVADDASATYWNPAGLTQISFYQVDTMLRSRFENFVKEQTISVVLPTSFKVKSTFGLSYFQSQIKDIPTTEALTQQQINQFQAGVLNFSERLEDVRDSAVLASYAFRANKHISFGLTGKVIDRNFLGQVKGLGYGLDAGILVHSGPLAIGFSAQDLVGHLGWKGNRPFSQRSINFEEKPATIFRAGTAYFMPLPGGGLNKLVMSLGGVSGPHGLDPQLGVELRFQAFQVRTGLTHQLSGRGSSADSGMRTFPSLGLGFVLKPIQLQYAITQHPLGWNQGASLVFQWGGRKGSQ